MDGLDGVDDSGPGGVVLVRSSAVPLAVVVFAVGVTFGSVVKRAQSPSAELYTDQYQCQQSAGDNV